MKNNKIYKIVTLTGILLFTFYGKGISQNFIFTFEGYKTGDTAFIQTGPEYRSPKYPLIISEGEVVYVDESLGNTLLAKIYVKGNYGTPFVLERGKIHNVKNGRVYGSVDNDNFDAIYNSLWGGEVFAKIMEASKLRDSAKSPGDKKMYYDLLIERHLERERKVREFLKTDTLGVGLYIAYVLRLTATPSEMKLWLDNHKRFSEDEYYKRIMAVYIPQSKTDLGMKLEDFQVVDLNGNKFSLYEFLQNFKGKAVILDFWASWCHACREKVPHLKEIYAKYKNRGLEIIGVSSDNTEDKWRAAIIKDGSGLWINVIDKNNITGKKYGIPAIPKSFVLDKNGIIHYYGVGGLADETETVEKLINQK